MRPLLFKIGPIPIWAYGTALTVAFIFGAWLGARRARRLGLDGEHIWNVATIGFIAAMLGARLAHMIVENPALFAQPAKWFSIWEGGLVFYGGFIAALGGALLYARLKKLDFWVLGDAMAPIVALGHGIVRIGCFLNGCCYGKACAWGVVFPVVDSVPRQPTQLYESAAGAAYFAGLLLWEKRWQRGKGELVLLYLAAYGLARFLIEFARDDNRGGTFVGLTLSQHIGLAAFVVGAAWFIVRRRAPTPPPTPSTTTTGS